MIAALEVVTKRLRPPQYSRRVRKTRSLLRAPLYRGTRVACPCCGGSFRRFANGRAVPRRANAECPRCGALERHRLLWLFLEQRTDFFWRRSTVLHLAPEPFLQGRLNGLKNLNYVSADLELPWAMVKVDVTDISYEDASFDYVLCLHVLEHVADDRAAMRGLLRILRPGGWAIVQSPVQGKKTFEDETIVSPRERRRLSGQHDHLRVYGRDLEQRLESVGFAVDVVPFAEQLGDEAARRYGLDPGESIYLAAKPGWA